MTDFTAPFFTEAASYDARCCLSFNILALLR